MQDIINLLPETLANQIAAGEVVQRPSSVVKELLENALDAQAQNIKLIVKDAGKTLVQVIDDGVGMSETDARMCFERHATSKISKTDDLFAIKTFGFRGEAMASIAAVAQVELKTRREDDETGCRIDIRGSEVKEQEPTACAKGASISVKNLFYNVPARRKFLKSNPVETKHIIEEFQRAALANPSVNMSMYQDDLETYNLRAGNLAKRIIHLFGKSYQNQLIPVEEQFNDIHIKGYIGKPECAKKSKGTQFFFVNDRFIRHPYLNHAVVNAFEGLITEDQNPFYHIGIYLDPRKVDVNVHPTKTEVKFDDERALYAIIRSAVKQALSGLGIAPTIDFEFNTNLGSMDSSAIEMDKPDVEKIIRQELGSGHIAASEETRQANNKRNWEKLYPGGASNQFSRWNFKEVTDNLTDNSPGEASQEELKFEPAPQSTNNAEQAPPKIPVTSPQAKSPAPTMSTNILVHKEFIVCQVKSGMLIINRKAAHQRVLYDKFVRQLENRSGSSQRLLFPKNYEFQPADFSVLLMMKEELQSIGFGIEEFGKNALMINGVPADLTEGDIKDVLDDLIHQFKNGQDEIGNTRYRHIAAVLAKKVAGTYRKELESEELNSLIEQLFASSNPNYTPDGKKIIVPMDLKTLHEMFS
ncbi:DNA mismatch repair endonuclease MutL [Rapidithrix thailandica]|uniref:DNA mismatch repair protein MutL n=1 Tax=Rapidithrix thailandica TaxID=413964 RepID=A0AAW9S7N8_9BACT